MATLTVSLPDNLKQYVDAQAEGGDFVDCGDYLRDLIRRDHERRLAELRQMVEEAIASGISDRTIPEVFEEAVERARQNGTLRD